MTRSSGIALLLALTTAACTLHPEDVPVEAESSATLAQTQQRFLEVARGALREAVGPAARLAPGRGGTETPITAHCTRFSKAPPGSPVNSVYYLEVRGADPTRVRAYLERFAAYLSARGWHRDPARGADAVGFRRGHYSISMTYAASTRYLSISGSTPCVKER